MLLSLLASFLVGVIVLALLSLVFLGFAAVLEKTFDLTRDEAFSFAMILLVFVIPVCFALGHITRGLLEWGVFI